MDGPETFRSSPRSSMLRANVFALESLCVLGVYGCILLWPKMQWPGHSKDAWRCQVLFVFGVVYMLRLNVMARWLLPRELATEELTVVILWILTILVSFGAGALLTGTPDDLSISLAVALYCLGSFVNTWSELQRKWWKAKPENKGRCYTLGLFSLSRNINYLGDVLLFLGWAAATGCWWNLWAPVVMAASFYFYHIPDKEQYLSERYKVDWPAYAASTKSFIPFLC
ncbi:Pfdn6 [Symbiodinium natans]|uniref:Pfdn6 protein n=1 Tax=Symbiodinium natans TaxID=878477 RepID=A0A812KI91_9DINO|nr:Pfdn6 [Symbiodinium natans]